MNGGRPCGSFLDVRAAIGNNQESERDETTTGVTHVGHCIVYGSYEILLFGEE